MRIAAVLLSLVVLAGAGQPLKPLPLTPLIIDSGGRQHVFRVELANTDATRDRGLMFRRALPPGTGMLIDYGEARVGVALWMKDTPLSLDLLFLTPEGRIARIEAAAQPESLAPIQAGAVIRAVLEIRGGQSKQLGIRPGDRVRHAIFGDDVVLPPAR